MNRRHFLRWCQAVGLGFATPIGLSSLSGKAVADEGGYPGPFFVVFNASGGWDTTYLMDQKEPRGSIDCIGLAIFKPSATITSLRLLSRFKLE